MEEDSYIVSNFHSICRLCLRKNGVMSSIFEYASEGEAPLYERIAELAEVQIRPNDGLPGRICHRCLYKTEKCIKFRSCCTASDAKLRRLTRKLPGAPAPSAPLPPRFLLEDSVVMVVDPSREDDSSDACEEEVEAEVEADVEEEERASPPGPPGAVFMCQYCDQAFTDSSQCRQHERSAHDEKSPYGCASCGLVFADRAGQATHARAVHACARPYPCPQCDKAFGRRSDLRKHSVVHTGVRPYRCHFCHKSFSRNTNLSKHLRIHSGHRPHVCPQCPRSFISKGDLARHALVHSGAKPFQCTHCPLTFGRRDKLAKHEARHARINNIKEEDDNDKDETLENIVVNVDPYKNIRDDDMDQEGYENQNELEYPGVPDHITGDSAFGFDPQQLLKEEIESPDEEDEDEDDESSLQNGKIDLDSKQSTVRNSHLLQCPHCALKFSSVDAFTKHAQIHEGIKGFRCKTCNKSFARKRELDRHAVVHTGFKPFECSRCDKKFGRKDKLVRHERIHDERKEFSCFECSATFTRKDSLMSHLKTHYPDLVRDNMDTSVNSDDDEDAVLSKDE